MCESHLHTLALARVLALVQHTEIWVVPQKWALLKTHTHMRGNTRTHTCMVTWICILTNRRWVESEFESCMTKIYHAVCDFI